MVSPHLCYLDMASSSLYLLIYLRVKDSSINGGAAVVASAFRRCIMMMFYDPINFLPPLRSKSLSSH